MDGRVPQLQNKDAHTGIRSSMLSETGAAPAPAVKKKAPAPPAPSQSKIPNREATTNLVTRVKADVKDITRPTAEHNFLTDVADVGQMEKGLLLLLEDFHNGKLQVFGRGCTFEQMDQVRERQEKLSRLHFDLDAQQQIYSRDKEVTKDIAFKNLNKLVENLEELNSAVHELKNDSISQKTTSKLTSKQRSQDRGTSELHKK